MDELEQKRKQIYLAKKELEQLEKEMNARKLISSDQLHKDVLSLNRSIRNQDANTTKALVNRLHKMVNEGLASSHDIDVFREQEEFIRNVDFYNFEKKYNITAKMIPGEPCFIAARPGMGKTTLQCNLVYDEIKRMRPWVYVSHEQAPRDIWANIIRIHYFNFTRETQDVGISLSYWDYYRLVKDPGYADLKKQFQEYFEMARSVGRVVRAKRFTVDHIMQAVDECADELKAKPETIFIDYFQQIKRSSNKDEREGLSEISEKLTEWIMNYQSFLFIATQATREKDDTKKAKMSQLGGTSQQEKDAQLIILLSPDENPGEQSAMINVNLPKIRRPDRGEKRETTMKLNFISGAIF
jgi:replicative DNA helicase